MITFATYYDYLQEWIKARSAREKVLVVLVGWAVIYLLWFLLCSRPLLLQQKSLLDHIAALKLEISALQEQSKTIIDFSAKNSAKDKLLEKQRYSSQSEQLKQRIETSVLSTLNEQDISKVVSDIINLPKPGIEFVNLKELTHEALIPSGLDSSSLPASLAKLQRLNMQLEINGDYFNSINYLLKLEKLPWRLYMDTFNYKVTTYPKAEAIINFYILVNQS